MNDLDNDIAAPPATSSTTTAVAPTAPAPELLGKRQVDEPTIEALLDPIAHSITPSQLWQFARTLAHSEIVPESLQGKPANVFAVMMRGLQLGIPPMTAICEINVIKGRTSLSAHLQVAKVLQSGKAKEFRIVETTRQRCVIRVQRHEWPEPKDVEFTLDEAKDLGLLEPRGKSGMKSPYVTQPANMLRRRCQTRACREHFPDVIIAYDPEEFEHETPPAGAWSAPPPAAAAATESSYAVASPPPPAAPPPVVDRTMAPTADLEERTRDPLAELVLGLMADITKADTAERLFEISAATAPLKERADKGDQEAAAHFTDLRLAGWARLKDVVIAAIGKAKNVVEMKAAAAPAKALKDAGEAGDTTAASHYAEIKAAYNERGAALKANGK
jgi:hypothetical protein